MISVPEALDNLFALTSVMPVEHVALRHANGRVLSREVTAQRTQPPFAASSMDGYALRRAEVELDAMFKVVGEAAAGHRYEGSLRAGQAVRIFTGAPVPDGADFVVIQEDVTRRGDLITLGYKIGSKDNIRPAGGDFVEGTPLSAPRRLRPADIALLAAMNIASVPVYVKPVVAIIATGDELVQPGESPGPDQIIASNTYGLAATLEELGATARLMPIARDNAASLKRSFELAQGADLIITIGGASVGDHDLVAPVAAELGMQQSFYKVAMRPGKPLMAGRLENTAMVGLPGNPVSAMVCGCIFVAPMIRAMLGLGQQPAPERLMPLAADIPANGPREHYMRANLVNGMVTAASRQDSSLLSVLATASALMVRPPNDPAQPTGAMVRIIDL
ncbi:molybdopterin molybdotransferase MoeA [Sulfitobacter sp.]|uniref:molybdopterin molybdotransferase MoeA n=1 Tax=Sulfitobacter sp. TaxID=1903071 RepID=UPI003002BED4